MKRHLTVEELEAFRRGIATADDVMAIVEHLRECSECGAHVRSAAAALVDDLSDVEHPEIDALFAYARGSQDGEIADHIAWCTQCSEDVADARRAQFTLRPERRNRGAWAALAAAAAVIIVAGAAWWLTQRRAEPLPGRVVHPVIHIAPRAPKEAGEWDAVVDEARKARAVAMPDVVRQLRVGMDEFRGEEHATARLDLKPSGTVVESQTPELRWSAAPNERFIVTVVCDDVRAARSGSTEGGHWTVSKPLPRGSTCTWQLERASDHAILPQPPAPQPMFRVLDAAHAAEIACAKGSSDDLTVGLLYARAGVQSEALTHLRAWLEQHPNDDSAAAIARSIERW